MGHDLPVRKLLVLRHAKAEHADGVADDARRLTSRGRRAARRAGEIVLAEGLMPDRVLCSSSARTRETLELLQETSGFDGPIDIMRELYLAERQAYLAALAERGGDARSVMVIGHNPGLESLVHGLTGEGVALPTAALLYCELSIGDWAEISEHGPGVLRRKFCPKDD